MKASDLRKGKTVVYEEQMYTVHESTHVAKGNKRSYMQIKLKNLKSGQILDVRFNVDDRLEVPFLDSREYEFLYQDSSGYIFMDTETFDQVTIGKDLIGDGIKYLSPNERVSCQVHDGNILTVELPNVVVLTVTETPPVVKGATATNQPKDAILETGAKVRVPPFIGPGEKLRIDTRSGEYIERAK